MVGLPASVNLDFCVGVWIVGQRMYTDGIEDLGAERLTEDESFKTEEAVPLLHVCEPVGVSGLKEAVCLVESVIFECVQSTRMTR